jgi:competence protein ComFC
MIQKMIQQLINFLFPCECSFCGNLDSTSNRIGICKACVKAKSSKISTEETCEICRTNLIDNFCEYCDSRNIFFDRLVFIRSKENFEREIIQRLKFRRQKQLAFYFCLNLHSITQKYTNNYFAGIVYIPSSASTIRQRPYHSCVGVLKRLEKKFQVKSFCPLEKVSKELQSGKNFRERFIHAAKAFQIKKKYENSFSGNYLLVDDVFTTGATVNEIAKLLLMNGANSVEILVLVKGK